MASELLEFPIKEGRGEPVYGIALNLEEDSVSAIILGDYTRLCEGDEVRWIPADEIVVPELEPE